MNKTASVLLVATLLLAACGREEPPAPRSEPPVAAADLDAGRTLAQAKCSNCHGLDGKGTGPAIPHLAGQKREYLQLALQQYRSGERPHAALQQIFSELTEKELNDVAAYYAAQPAIVPEHAAQIADAVAAGKTAAAACAACHGADGNSTHAGTPSLAGQHRDYLITAMQAYKQGERKHASMQAQLSALDSVSLQNLADYYAAQPVKAQARKVAGEVATGERLSSGCGKCHGLQGHTIDAATPALAAQDPQYLVATMKAYRDGSRAHPEMQRLLARMNDAQLNHIAAFYAAQTPKQHGTPGGLIAAQWAERCDRCHGPGASNPEMIVPRIDGQPQAYLAQVLHDYRDDKRHQSAMHAMGQPLTDADIAAISEYYAALAPR